MGLNADRKTDREAGKSAGRETDKGYTLVELIVVLTILAILCAIMIPSYTGYIEEAHKKLYLVEAERVKDSIELYLLEQYPGEAEDVVGILEVISEHELDSPDSPLADYLLVDCTEGAYIRNLTVGKSGVVVTELIYIVDGYRIELMNGKQSIVPVQTEK